MARLTDLDGRTHSYWPYIELRGSFIDEYFTPQTQVGVDIAGSPNIIQVSTPPKEWDFTSIFELRDGYGFLQEPGTYPATLTITNSTCAVSKTINIVVPEYPSECSYRIPNVPLQIRQCDARYNAGGIVYDDSCRVAADGSTRCETICGEGCALASLTMLMNSKGCNVDLLTVNGCKECFNKGNIKWDTVVNKFCPSLVYDYTVDRKDFGSYPKPIDTVVNVDQVKRDMENGYDYILFVKLPERTQCTHFVLLKGISKDCKKFEIIDPSGFPMEEVSAICGYRRIRRR